MAIIGKETDQTKAINEMYDRQMNAQRTELESAYNRSVSDAQAAADKIPQTYQERANDLAVQYERNRRNLNQQAAGNGINTGAASQQALALNNVWQKNYGANSRAQAEAATEADRGIANLRADYEAKVQAAVAQNDYQRAAALLDEYNNGYQREVAQADRLAQFGDFTRFGDIYGQDAAANAQTVWAGQNPVLAWYLGKISAEDYYKLTGEYPQGYSSGGGGYYGGGSSNKGGDDIYSQIVAAGVANGNTAEEINRALMQTAISKNDISSDGSYSNPNLSSNIIQNSKPSSGGYWRNQ